MFVHNETSFECVLAKARLTDHTAVLSVNVEVEYPLDHDALSAPAAHLEERPEDFPPDLTKLPLWRGTSVTASGRVWGPERAPFVKEASLGVNGKEHRLVISGERRWQRSKTGDLVPGAPERFESLEMSWQRAFGGSYEVPPGLDPHAELPSPGGPVSHPDNPLGVGFYPDDLAAEGQPLPRIEIHGEDQKRPQDRPTPGGMSPCPTLAGLRAEPALVARLTRAMTDRDASPDRMGVLLDHALRMQHPAPGPLVFDWIQPGTVVRLTGLADTDWSLTAPMPPLTVASRRGRSGQPLRGRLRLLHLDAERRRALALFGFAQRYDPARPPHWIEVRAAGEQHER